MNICEDDRIQLQSIMRLCIRGIPIGTEEGKFLRKMLRDHHGDYVAIHREVKDQATAELNPLFKREITDANSERT